MTEETLKIIKQVHKIFTERGLSLSVAESCTGGLLSHYLTSLAGSSRFFEAGVVTYSALSKQKILGISASTLSSYGLVSRQTATEMADRMRLLTGTDYSLSTTGNLGPEVLEGKEKGLVYCGMSKEGKTIVKELRLKGSRAKNREEAVLLMFGFLIEELAGQK
jgi:PncC family amidohydrolase